MFDLYRQEKAIFTFDDYNALLEECRTRNANRVLEFGPGISTLALIESGCGAILTCEYNDRWFNSAHELFKGRPEVSLLRYRNDPEVSVAGLAPDDTFDLAFVDSPIGIPSRGTVRHPGQEDCNRLNTVLFALERAAVVLLHDAKRPGEEMTLSRVAASGHAVSMIDTRKGIARIERAPHAG